MRGWLVNWWQALLAALVGVLGVFIALHHPLAPVLLTSVFAAWSLAVFLRPAIWPFVLPALLPVAGFSPWTGWVGVEEFDVLVLGAATGAHARLAIGAAGEGQAFRLTRICLGLMALSWLLALLRGLLGAGSFRLVDCLRDTTGASPPRHWSFVPGSRTKSNRSDGCCSSFIAQ